MMENETPTKANNDDVDVVLKALRERNIDRPEQILNLATPDAILGACQWFDERKRTSPNITPGLLVNCIREGGKPGYTHSQAKPTNLPVTPKLLNAIRGRCLTPDGARRTEVLDMFASPAERRGLTANQLVTQAMGPHWDLTPPHPAMLLEDGRLTDRYSQWVGADRDKPDPTVIREPGESLLAYASRFWRWQHP